MNEWVKRIIAVIVGALATAAKLYGLIIACVCLAIVFDVISGTIASKATGKELSSKIATAGFWKKLGLIVSLFFGIFLDVFIPIAIASFGVVLPFNTPFGLIFGCYIVFNESISIAENLDRTNPGILPKWVKKLLLGGKEKIDGQMPDENVKEENKDA